MNRKKGSWMITNCQSIRQTKPLEPRWFLGRYDSSMDFDNMTQILEFRFPFFFPHSFFCHRGFRLDTVSSRAGGQMSGKKIIPAPHPPGQAKWTFQHQSKIFCPAGVHHLPSISFQAPYPKQSIQEKERHQVLPINMRFNLKTA